MIIIKAKFSGNQKDLNMFLSCGIKDYSTKILALNSLFVTWISEETSYEKALEDCMSLVNMRQMDLWNIDCGYIS